MLKWVFGRLSEAAEEAAAKEEVPSYDEAKRIASEGSVAERAKLAALRLLPPELLYFFATDKAPEVRHAVARNDGTPLQADLLLAKDDLPQIRSDMGMKVARLLPALSSEQNRRVSQMAYQVLEILAQDQLPDIRAMVSEQIKSLDNAPKDLVLRLAKDVESIVAAPVLEFSPMLTDQDLIDVIKAGIQGEFLAAIARRDMLSEDVSSAVAQTEDDLALPALLKNKTARLDRKTLLMIVSAGINHPAWHDALAHRDDLDKTLAERVAGYVSESLVEHLIMTNTAITPEIADELRAGVRDREEKARISATDKEPEDEVSRAASMYRAGELTSSVMTLAASREEKQFVVYALSHLTGASAGKIEKALWGKRGNRLAVALAWKTRLGMEFAAALQANLLGLSEVDVIRRPESAELGDDYPLDTSTMSEILETIGIY